MNETANPSLEIEQPRPAERPGMLRERYGVGGLGKGLRLAAAVLAVLALPIPAARIASWVGPHLASADPDGTFAWISVHHLAQLILTLMLMALWSSGSLKPWGFNLNEAKVSLRWLGWFALFCTVGMLVFGILPMLYFHHLPSLNFRLNARNATGSLGFYYLLSGLGEEPLCRGFVMTVLLVSWKGGIRVGKVFMPTAGLLATLIFMLAHVGYELSPPRITNISWQQQIFCLGFGLFYAAAFWRTQSLLCPILAHGFSNGIIWTLIYLAVALTPVPPVQAVGPDILGRVSLEPNPPVAGREATVVYDASAGPLVDAKQLSVHIGFDGWRQASDRPLTGLSQARWQLTLPLPPGARRLDFAFTDGARWDNNERRDWHIPIRPPAPLPPGGGAT